MSLLCVCVCVCVCVCACVYVCVYVCVRACVQTKAALEGLALHECSLARSLARPLARSFVSVQKREEEETNFQRSAASTYEKGPSNVTDLGCRSQMLPQPERGL